MVHIRTFPDQETYNVGVFTRGLQGVQDRRLLLIVLVVDLGLLLGEVFNDLDVAFLASDHKGGTTFHRLLGLDVGALVEKKVDALVAILFLRGTGRTNRDQQGLVQLSLRDYYALLATSLRGLVLLSGALRVTFLDDVLQHLHVQLPRRLLDLQKELLLLHRAPLLACRLHALQALVHQLERPLLRRLLASRAKVHLVGTRNHLFSN